MLIEDLRRPNGHFNNTKEVLYHKDIGFPDDINLPRGFSPVMDLQYSAHANEEALKDRYGEIRLPHRIDVRKGTTIEIGVTNKTVTKMVIRFSYDETLDIVLVIIPDRAFVKTVWFNKKTDTHKSLDHSKYADPNQKEYPMDRVRPRDARAATPHRRY